MDILKVKDLTKQFKSFRAVDTISFSLKEGEILGLLGPNGAGKTTTIQMLLGVLTPTSGTVEYFGKDLKTHREDILEQVNFSSTYTNLPWNLTVKENLTFISYLYGIKDRKKRIEKITKMFKLEPLLNQKIQELSAGQLTRVNLAKAFINFPKVLLLDEPTASLDPDVAQYIRQFLLSERKEFQVSIIITSHNMAEVEEVCDRVIFINEGKIIADDKPENLAKTIEISHVALLIKDGFKRTVEYCEKHGIKYKHEGRYIVIDVKEKEIPDLLRKLMDIGVYYDEISIEKPTLEDYFLQMTHKKEVSDRMEEVI
jgi:ABC-2 type transport system ATP-binding protein